MSAPIPKPPPPPGTALSRCDNKLSMIVSCYSELKKMATGRYLKSVAVAAGGHTWRVAFFPSGRLAGTADSVSVYLLLDDDAAGADADADADDVHHVEARFTLHEVGCLAPRLVSPKVAGAYGGRRRDKFIGYDRFVSRQDLENLDFIAKHGRFTIWCDFTVFPKSGKPTAVAATPPAARAPRPSTSGGLPADLGRLLETKKGADLTFEVGGKVFTAHKLVLAARSPVFMADFFGPPPAKEEKNATTGYIRICDMHPDSFQALLHYIYTDALPETKTATNATGDAAAAALAGDLLVAADRYGLEHLKSLAEKELCRRNVGVGTALPMLALAERHRCRELKERCLEFIASGRNTRAVMATDGGVEHLARSCPSVVKEVITKVMDAREATPRNPLMMVSVDASVYFYALMIIVPFVGLWLCFVIASS